MPGFETLGRWLLIGGLTLAILGGLIWLVGRLFPNLNQIPGTIRVQSGAFTCVIPLLASLVLSILLTIVLNILVRIIRR